MAVPLPHPTTPYSANSTDASWKAAKTTSIGDKWNTELGAALRAAKVAYDKIKFDQLDVGFIRAKHGQFHVVTDVEMAKKGAVLHYNNTVKPAIKALADAQSKAAWAGRNLVISKAANTKAKQIAADLAIRLAQLKGIAFGDFDTEIAAVQRVMQFTHANYATNMTRVLADADRLVAAVRKKPTPKTFNAGIQDAARGITQMIGQAEKLKKNGFDLQKPNPQALFDDLEEWAQGRDQLPDTATKKAVLAAISVFELRADAVAHWWA